MGSSSSCEDWGSYRETDEQGREPLRGDGEKPWWLEGGAGGRVAVRGRAHGKGPREEADVPARRSRKPLGC